MQPFRTILVAADFSENSSEAFGTACSLAVEDKTRLFVLHVADREWATERPVYHDQQTMQFGADLPDESRQAALKQKLSDVYVPHHPLDVEYQTREGNASRRFGQEDVSSHRTFGANAESASSWSRSGLSGRPRHASE